MNYLVDTYKKKGNLHHAYVIEGERELVRGDLFKFFENKVGISTSANPDFYYGEFEHFGIDDGRKLQEMASRRALVNGIKIFVIAFVAITREAQNSLLKLFEEPPTGTHFFVVVPKTDILLPTLLSRMFAVYTGGNEEKDSEFIKKFLKASKANRLIMLKEIVNEKNREKSLAVVNSIEKALYGVTDRQKITSENISLFEEIQKLRKDLNTRSASVKMILEHISLITPVMK